MKTNLLSFLKQKSGFTILLMLFFGLFANQANAQSAVGPNDTFVWTGLVSSDWTDAGNWNILRATTAASVGSNNYPNEDSGQTSNVVWINNSATPFPAILKDGEIFDIARLNVTNAFGGEAGATFTINQGAVLNVGNFSQSNNVILSGGNIVNNGTLNITATGVGFQGFPVIGINCGGPAVVPSVPTEYGYSGTGELKIDLVTANFAGAAAIAQTGNSGAVTTPANNVNVTYKLILNNPEINLNQASAAGINVIRTAGGNNANKLIIGGTGFTVGGPATLVRPLSSIGSLINLGGGSDLTILAGTTLTFNSVTGNNNSIFGSFSGSAFPTNFTNKGNIIVRGASSRSGMSFATGSTNVGSVINVNNEGTIDINLNIVGGGHAPLNIGNGGGGAANIGSVVNINNTGTMDLRNSATAVATGFPIFTTSAGEAAALVINNSGTLNLEGTTYAYGLKTTVNNSGTLNSNSELRNFRTINNNAGGILNFVRTAATATTRLVSFTIVTDTDQTGGVGSIYKDAAGNDYGIIIQKYGSGFDVVANVSSTATIPPTGTLTRVSPIPTPPGGISASIVYTAVSISPLNNAMGGTLNNSGVINNGATASSLNAIGALTTTTETSVLSPGGDRANGLMTISNIETDELALKGTIKMQVSGNTTEGVDYDAILFTGQLDVIDISQTILDVTGIYTPTTLLAIDIIKTNATLEFEGAIAGQFASVVGLPRGWEVKYTEGVGNKVQLAFDPALTAAQFAQAKFSYYPNPTKNQLNVTAAKTINKVELYNVLGQKVLTNVVNATQKQVDISTLQKGIYMMEVSIENTKQTFKIVKD